MVRQPGVLCSKQLCFMTFIGKRTASAVVF